MKRVFSIILFVAAYVSLRAEVSVEAVRRLSERIAPEIAGFFEFKAIDSPSDTFNVSMQPDGKVLVEGSTTSAMSVGLNNFLRNCLGADVSWFASQPVVLPTNISDVGSRLPISGKTDLKKRFFLNYCTFGYTTPFWEWDDWERLIDWMALNGVNMPLAMTGQEKTWLETWEKIGLPTDSVLDSFTGPSHLPWHWMLNIDHFQGPLSKNWIESSAELQKKILSRERELGMKPVLPAFNGHVPASLRSVYPEARITDHKPWCGFKGADNTHFLDPADPLYATVQNVFITTQDSLYGTDHIYGVDPFNEVEAPDWSEEFLKGAASHIYSTLCEADSSAVWLQMTWTFYNDSEHWTNPRIKAYLDGVPRDRLILLDYYCEVQPVWKITESFFGKPSILCYLGNFGGNTMITGNLADLDYKIDDYVANGGEGVSGVGCTLEGLDVNPVMYEFMFAKAWDPTLTHEKWIDIWAEKRGAKDDESVREAWHLLNEKIYIDHSRNGQGGLTNVRPSLTKVSGGCADARYNYANGDLVRVLDKLLEAKECTDLPAYRFDVVNVCRQALANEFKDRRDALTRAYNNGNIDSVRQTAAVMDSMLMDLDRLMSSNPDYSLARWIEKARRAGRDEAEADKYEKNFRTLLTTWGYPGTVLNDYANRHWSGLTDSYYRVRWNRFTQAVIESMEQGTPFDEDRFREDIIAWEATWPDSRVNIEESVCDDPVGLARQIRERYFDPSPSP